MKKIKKTVKLLRDIITIIGIPAIGILGWRLHQEQLNLKNFTIETKNAEIEFLKDQRSLVIIDELKKTRTFMNSEIKRLNDTISILKATGMNSPGIGDTRNKTYWDIKRKLDRYKSLVEFSKLYEEMGSTAGSLIASPSSLTLPKKYNNPTAVAIYSAKINQLEQKYFGNKTSDICKDDNTMLSSTEAEDEAKKEAKEAAKDFIEDAVQEVGGVAKDPID